MLWARFLSFLDAVSRCMASGQVSMTDDQRTSLQGGIATVRQLDGGADCEAALRAYFDQPPAHLVAVNTLDHSQFVLPLRFPAAGVQFPLRDVLALFSSVPQAYADLWMALLDVAQLANGTLNCEAGREYIRAQATTAPGTAAAPPSLDSLLGGVLSAFPGFQDCMSRMTTAQASREDLGGMMDQMQNIIMGPVMESIRASNPDAPDIGPAITQILEGFRSLNAAILANNKVPTAADGDLLIE